MKDDDDDASHIIIDAVAFAAAWRYLLYGILAVIASIGVATKESFTSPSTSDYTLIFQGQADNRRIIQSNSDRIREVENYMRVLQDAEDRRSREESDNRKEGR